MKYIKFFKTEEERNKENLEGPFISYILETDKLEYENFTPISLNSNPELMNVVYNLGWAEHKDYMTMEECKQVTNVQFSKAAGSSSTTSLLSNDNIKDFSAFKYFTSVTSTPGYMFKGCKFTKIEFPDSIETIGAFIFANHGMTGSIDLSKTKIKNFPLLYSDSVTGVQGLKGIILPETCSSFGNLSSGVFDTGYANRTGGMRWVVLPYKGRVKATRYAFKDASKIRFYVSDEWVDVYKSDNSSSRSKSNADYYFWESYSSKIFPISQFLEDLDNGVISM